MSPARADLPMTVRGVASGDVVTASPETTLEALARTMADRNVGSVVIVEDGEPVGIVTDRDLAIRLLADEGSVNLFESDVDVDELTAADVMTPEPHTVTEGDELPRVLHHMTESSVKRVPVVDEEGRVSGIVTLDDVVVHLAGESTHVSAQLDNVAGIIRSESPGA